MVIKFTFKFLILAFISSICFNCNNKIKAGWQPNESPPVVIQQDQLTFVDQGVLADMLMLAMIEFSDDPVIEKVEKIYLTGFPTHPQNGPFFFECGERILAVADNKSRIIETLEFAIHLPFKSKDILFFPFLETPYWNKIKITKAPIHINLKPEYNNEHLEPTGKIKLTPDNMAAALSQFTQWEGVHLDTALGELRFIGSNDVNNPQLSASDLVAAYRAVFENEANGEAIFVDMDFAENKEEYLVTFGGSLEDTRPGRVLYSSDLLLKALSSGIDPWTSEKPLIELMCNSRNKSDIQTLFCEHIKPSLKHYPKRNIEIINYYKNFKKKEEMADLILLLSVEADKKEKSAWEYVFFTNDSSKQAKIEKEIEEKGYFTFYPDSSPLNLKEAENLEKKKLSERLEQLLRNGTLYDSVMISILSKLYENSRLDSIKVIKVIEEFEKYKNQTSRKNFYPDQRKIGYGCVPKNPEYLKNPESDCDTFATLNRVRQINSIPIEQKKIVLEARKKFSKEKDRKLYATLAFASPKKIHPFLRSADIDNITRLFQFIQQLENNQLYNEEELFQANLSMLLFMSENKGFLEKFLDLNEEEQLVLGFITSQMIMNPELGKMINQLQYHQPLCCNTCKIPTSITSFIDAYKVFICKHLSQYGHTYLADLIKNEIQDSFNYFTAIDAGNRFNDEIRSDSIRRVRYWFYPGNEVLILADNNQLNNFLFHHPHLEAKAENLDQRLGPYETGKFYEHEIPGIKENLEIINTYYSELSEIFPTLKELSNLVRTLAFFRWVKYYQNSKLDLSAFEFASDYGTPTPRTYPVIETVMALSDGSLVRLTGGVDLHSQTQVGFDRKKISEFVNSLKKSYPARTFNLKDKTYFSSFPITGKTQSDASVSKRTILSSGIITIYLEENENLNSFSQKKGERISWYLSNGTDDFNKYLAIFTDFKNTSCVRTLWWPGAANELSWTIEEVSEGITASLSKNNEYKANTSKKFIDQHCEKLSELCEMDLPFDAIWSYASTAFENVILTRKNGVYKLSFHYDGKEETWVSDENCQFSTIDEAKVSSLGLEENVIPESSNSVQFVGVELKAKVPTDSLIIDEYGYRNDSLLEVQIHASSTSTMDILEWRDLITSSTEMEYPWKTTSAENYIIANLVKEEKKGAFDSYNLTNRAFLIEQVADLRSKRSGNYYGYMNSIPASSWHGEVHIPGSKDNKRFFVIDTLGFIPSGKEALLDFAKNNRNSVSIATGNGVELPSSNAVELIWISTLSEKLLQKRLENFAEAGYFKEVNRLRVFNVNNPVYDLGNNLFQLCSNLKGVGAWTHIIDFDLLMVLVDELQTSKVSDLDAQIFEIADKIQEEYRKTPTTTFRLRMIRKLPQIYYSWEELRPVNESETKWRISIK
jgi:hypothetical protein